MSPLPARLAAAVALCLPFLQDGEPAPPQVAPPPPLEPVPSARQRAWQRLELYGFLHFGPNTFTGAEWGSGQEDPAVFAPSQLDCRQWARVASEAGLRGLILTAKHHDGFCLWPSALTDHTVAHSPWRDGKGDVVAELAAACREYGLELGLYLSPWDRHEETYGSGKPYDDFFCGQLEELLTGYGRIFEVWFDGANGEGPDGRVQVYDWQRYVETVRRLQPGAVVFGPAGPDVRWVGNENGVADETNWAPVRLSAFTAGSPTAADRARGHPDGDHWMPAECDVSIRSGWFWSDRAEAGVKSAETLEELWLQSVGRNASLLLNVPPDARGLIPEEETHSLAGLRRILDATFALNLAQGAGATATNERGGSPDFAASRAIDGDPETYWATDDGVVQASLELDLFAPVMFNRIQLQERVALGQRVSSFVVEAFVGGDWHAVGQGTTIGHRRVLALDSAVSARKVRLIIKDARACLALAELGLFLAPPRVRIEPPGGDFLGTQEVTLESDVPGAEIHYTLDGSEPTLESPRYQEPFRIADTLVVRARAFAQDSQTPEPARAAFKAWRDEALREPVTFVREPDPGLAWDAVLGEFRDLTQVDWSDPQKSGVASDFNLDVRPRDSWVAVRWSGFLRVPVDGLYRFWLRSDDGSRLWIGNSRVVDDDGRHGPAERSGAIGLRAGWHPLRVEYFNATGDLELEVSWSRDQAPRAPLPADLLAH